MRWARRKPFRPPLAGSVSAAQFPAGIRSRAIVTPSPSPEIAGLSFEAALRELETIVARLEPAAHRLTPSQILAFTRDVEEGLIDEFADFIEAYMRREEVATSRLSALLSAPEKREEAAERQLCYSSLGRGRRNRNGSPATQELLAS